jgi:TniQ
VLSLGLQNVPSRRLRVRSQPIGQEESLNGYFLRLAEANGYVDPALLEGLAGLPRGCVMTRPCDLTAASRIAEVDEDVLRQLVCWPAVTRGGCIDFGRGGPVSTSVLDLVHPKICIACLREAAWVRREWDIRLLLACPRHGFLLLDACPSCGKRLSWRRPGLSRCACGTELLGVDAEAAPSMIVDLARKLSDLAAGHASPDSGAGPLDTLDVAVRLAWFVACDLSAVGGEWRSQYMSKPPVRVAIAPVEAAASVLLEWPNGLHAWLDRRPRAQTRGTGVRATFGPLFHRLLNSLQGPSFAFLHDEVRRWLADEWKGGHVKPWSRLFTSSACAHVLSGKEAAKRLRVSPARIVYLCAEGVLAGESRRAGSRRVHLIPIEAVENLERRTAASLSAAQIAGRIGISVGQTERLAKAGLLGATSSLPGRPRGMRFEEAALADLETQLERRVAADYLGGTDALTLAELSKRRQVAFAEILRDVLDGELSVGRASAPAGAPLMERYHASPARVVERRRARASGKPVVECLCEREIAVALGIAVRMVTVLVRAGCLQSIDRTCDRVIGKRSVTAASITTFRTSYVMSRELALAHATSTRVIVQRLAALGVEPVVRSDTGRGVSGVWRRIDCERL